MIRPIFPHRDPVRLPTRRLVRMLFVLGTTACSAASAQPQDGAAGGRFQVGTILAEPGSLRAAAPTTSPLACEMICSPFDPRQSIAQISWPEQTATPTPREGGPSLDLGTLRLDIIGGAGSFEDGDFGTVRLSAVPVVEAQPDIGIDLQEIRTAVAPATFQPVRDNRILARDPALPAPEELMRERVPGALEQLSAPARAALERDAQTGGLGRMQVAGQAVELRRSVPHRTVVVQGMQPGLTYKIRLVQEAQGAANSLAQNICRVPVCPADFVRQ